MAYSKKPLIIAIFIFSLLSGVFQVAQALTFTEVINLLQSPDINLPTGVTNPKGNIGFILSNLFWGTADGTKNGKIKPQYLDYSGISAWTQSGTITYLTISTGSVGIGTSNPGGYTTAIRGIDNAATAGALWVSGQTATTPGLMVRNDGNVGIGTASPSDILTISGATGPIIGLNGPTTNYRGLKMSDGAGVEKWFAGANNLGNYVIRQNSTTDIMTFSGGLVGIGTTAPTEKLEVNGNVKATAFLYSSDRRLKDDIRTITHPLQKIQNLRGVTFQWKEDGRADIGVIAQEVEQVFPELVKTGANGMKSVEYGNLVGPLIESVKELKHMIDVQNEQINSLKAQISTLTSEAR